MKISPFTLLCLLLICGSAAAMTLREENFTCPLCGHKFTQTVPGSGTSYGIMSDFQLYGAISSPWEQPECPQDRFVLYSERFTEDELAILRPYVHSAAYQSIGSQYWRINKLREQLGASPADRYWLMVQATWETHGNTYDAYAKETISALHAALQKEKFREEGEREAIRLLIGELHRRLADFEQAYEIFETLAQDPACLDNDLCARMVDLQLQLAAIKDSSQHRVPEKGGKHTE